MIWFNQFMYYVGIILHTIRICLLIIKLCSYILPQNISIKRINVYNLF